MSDRIVRVEADWPDAYRVNRYVRGASDDRDSVQALGDFGRFPTWMWRNTDVVDKNDGPVAQRRELTIAAVQRVTTLELEPFPHRNGFDGSSRNPELIDDVFAEHSNAAARDCAHRELRMTGNAELADEEDVERRIQRSSYFERHRYSATGKCEHSDVVAIRVRLEAGRELASRVGSIGETHMRSLRVGDPPWRHCEGGEAGRHTGRCNACAQRLQELLHDQRIDPLAVELSLFTIDPHPGEPGT